MKKISTSLIYAGLLTLPIFASAAGESIIPTANDQAAGNIGKDVKFTDQPIDQILNAVANYVIGALIILAVFYVLWAAYTFVTSAGSEEKVNDARKRILYAAIGVIVALLAKGIVSLVLKAAQG